MTSSRPKPVTAYWFITPNDRRIYDPKSKSTSKFVDYPPAYHDFRDDDVQILMRYAYNDTAGQHVWSEHVFRDRASYLRRKYDKRK